MIFNTVNVVSSAIGWANERSQKLAEEEKQLEIECLYSALAKIAKADGSVTKNSINAIKKIFKRYSYTEEQQGLCILYFNEAKNKPLTIKTYTVGLAKLVNKKCEREIDSALNEDEGMNEYIKCIEYYFGEIMNLFCEVAVADGQPSPNKLHLLKEVEESFMDFYKSLFELHDKEISDGDMSELSVEMVEVMYKERGMKMSREAKKEMSEVLLKLRNVKFKLENIFKGLVDKCLRNQMNQDADF